MKFENFIYITSFSILSGFIISGLIAVVILKLPRDYFIFPSKSVDGLAKSSFSKPLVKIIQRVIGLVLFIVGAILTFLPGPGVITMIVGIALLDLPFNRLWLKRPSTKASVLGALNQFRKRFGKSPFLIE